MGFESVIQGKGEEGREGWKRRIGGGNERLTTRNPTHDSAILTSKLSCAHFLAA